jgi:hypothetical protein
MSYNPTNERRRKALVQKGKFRVVLVITTLQQLFRTFRALSNKTQILAKLEEVAGELEDDMVRGGWTGKTVTLKFKLDTFQGKPRFAQHLGVIFLAHVPQSLREQSRLTVGSVRKRKTFLQ